MRFKVFYNEKINEIDISCLKDKNKSIILPEALDQHVSYPIPKDMEKIIKKELFELIDKKETEKYLAITGEIQELQNKRKNMIEELRAELNPKILKTCEGLKERFPEYYI